MYKLTPQQILQYKYMYIFKFENILKYVSKNIPKGILAPAYVLAWITLL